MKKVLIATALDSVAKDLLTANGNYTVVQDKRELADLAKEHPDTYALIVRSEKVTAAVIDALPQLKLVVRAGAGVDTIDGKYARSKGIDVMNTPGANSNGVAEEVVAMMLADARHIVAADASTRRGEWEKTKFMGREVAGKTVGIVGLGNIGRLVARRLSGFDCRLLGYDPMISSDRAKDMNVELASLDTIFSTADYVTLHLPENEDTRGMLNRRYLTMMKPGATIINCARAGIVNEEDLRAVKAERKIRFLNDVYPKDAPGPKSIQDVADLMMPHLGASTFEANANAARRAAEEIIEFDEKGITSFIVNRDIPEGLDEAFCNLAYTIARLCRCLVGRNATLKIIETSFYGELETYADWLLVPVVSGIWENFDRSRDSRSAVQFLQEMGIEYVNRKTDRRKGYDNSITVDLTAEIDTHNLRQMSIRGTVAEGVMMVSRINEFSKLFFEPVGPTLFFLYDDRPGVIGAIGQALANAGVNIEDMRNPHDPKTNRSLAILKINQIPGEALMQEISKQIRAIAAFSIKL